MADSKSNLANLLCDKTHDQVVTSLTALAWTLQDPARARRLLDLTGLTPDGLRAGAGDRRVLAAVLDFLASHEPDLLACAEAIGVAPAELIQARDMLST